MNDETTSTVDTSPVESATPAEVDSGTEIVQAQEQTSSTETEDQGQDESFFDPKQVSPELMPAYKQMQAAFTKKTQEIAAERKTATEAKEKADKFSKYEQYIPVFEEMLSSSATPEQSPEMVVLESQLRKAGYSDEAIEMMKIGAGFTLNQFNQSKEAEKREADLERGYAEAEKLDPRLNDESLSYQTKSGAKTFGQIVAELANPRVRSGMNPVDATRESIELVDALMGRAKLEGKEELSASAKNKAQKFPQVNTSPQSASGGEIPNSVHDAFKQAREELGM